MFTFLILCLNKDKTCSGKKNSTAPNPNTSIPSFSLSACHEDMTAFSFTSNNNEPLISILMRRRKQQRSVLSWLRLTKPSDMFLMTELNTEGSLWTCRIPYSSYVRHMCQCGKFEHTFIMFPITFAALDKKRFKQRNLDVVLTFSPSCPGWPRTFRRAKDWEIILYVLY